MKTTQLNSTLKNEAVLNHSLSSYLRNLLKGRDPTPHSWLYENESSDETLRRWIPIMEKANLANSDFGDEFNQFDKLQLVKFGPQGKVPSIESKEALDVIEPIYAPSEYDDEEALSTFFGKTKEFAQVLFGRLCTKRPLSYERVVDDMRERDTLTTNSGWPRFARRERVKDAEIEDAKTGKAYDYPAIALFRQYNGKLRLVWMYPMSMNLIENTFAQPLQEALRHSPQQWVREYLSPWEGYEQVKATLTKQWDGNSRMFGGDTTAMDAHMRRAQIRLVFEIVKWCFQPSSWEQLKRCMLHVNDIPLVIGPDKMAVGAHGLASGAGWTQISETTLQLFMAWLDKRIGQGIGDDFYWKNKPQRSAAYYVDWMAQFGLPAKPEKQSDEADSLTFLQRMNRRGFFSRDDSHVLGGYYPTIRALNSSLNPERFHNPKDWNSDMFCIRQYMILENCVDDPCFPEFLKFVVSGQKDLIPFAKKQAAELNRIQQQARIIPGLNPSYNQEKREKPLSSFTSIRMAKEL